MTDVSHSQNIVAAADYIVSMSRAETNDLDDLQVFINKNIGFPPCWNLVESGRCRQPKGHEGECIGIPFEGDKD